MIDNELKFRAWDTKRNQFVDEGEICFCFYGDTRIEVHPNSQSYIGDGVHNGEPQGNRFIIEQFTGLTDKNGKEIYCHDIIHSLYSDGSSCSHIIKWVDSEARFMIFDLVTDRECGGISQGWINEHKKQVIGNIHESKINF